MAFQCGFFNSINGDRLYNAEQMNNPYHRIVSDGVFANKDRSPSNDFQVISNNNLTVTVKTGEGIFFGKWAKMDADMLLNIPAPHATYPRIDSVVVRINNNDRVGSVEYISGDPASNPVPPTLADGSVKIKDYRLANILVEANTSSVSQGKITDTRPSAECGFVTHLLEQSDISATYIQWQSQFDEWFNNLKDTLSTVTAITSLTSHYTAVSDNQTVIPIQISRFNSVVDILQVYINGMILIPNVEYTVSGYNTITLTSGVDIGTEISFIVYKSVDGSDAETVIQQVTNLFNISPVNSNGSAKRVVMSDERLTDKFLSLGVGFWTLECRAGAKAVPTAGDVFNVYGQLVDSNNGWMIAIRDDSSVYIATLKNREWSAWKTISATDTDLWTGEKMMAAGESVEPTKPLSSCKTGWVLVWSDYDEVAGTSGDFDYVTTFIYKKSSTGSNWNGQSHMDILPATLSSEGVLYTAAKKLYVYNDRLVGYAGNAVTAQGRNVCLRAVYEF